MQTHCVNCGAPLPSGLHRSRKTCAWCYRRMDGVYRYVCPEGRSYVGSSSDIRNRNRNGIDRSNPWLIEAFKKHPPETWRFEVLEEFPSGSSSTLFHAEQDHIERFRSWDPAYGYNFYPAIQRNTPGALAAQERQRRHVQAYCNKHLKQTSGLAKAEALAK